MNKFEQLIEYVINDDEANAKALFHEIVVDKSRDIYEEIMAEEEVMEKQGYKDREDEHLGAKDGAESGKKQSMKDRRDDEMGKEGKRDKDNDNDQKIDETDLGGSQVDDLIDDIESEEQGATFEDEEEEIEMIDIDVDDNGGEEELEDRVVDIEDKLDELMSEFEELMGQVDDNTDDIDGEQDEIDGIDGEQDEIDGIEGEMDEPIDVNVEVEGFNENVDLVPAPKPVTTSPASKSPVAANSGQKGMDAHPVNFDDGNKGKEGRPTPKYVSQDNTTKPDVKPATKPNLAQASGVNTKSVID